MERIPMVAKIFSKSILSVIIIILLAIITVLAFQLRKEKEANTIYTSGLDRTLEQRLQKKVVLVLSEYSQKGWSRTLKSLDEVRWECKRGGCDFEIFFNEFLDHIANTVSNNQEFTLACGTLGLLYPGNWRLADIDGDAENEVILLQRDALNVNYILLKIIDFQNEPRVVSYKLSEGYFSSQNSFGGGSTPLEILDITGDKVPEVLTFVAGGKGGAHLYIFSYKNSKLNLVLKKDDLFYPEYIFTDRDNDGVLDVFAEGYDGKSEKKVKQKIL